ncbi:MAG: ribosome silencing factor [Anaerolineales bacterium]|nr:ribosome silencing factor [Anaerolineales bacterium]
MELARFLVDTLEDKKAEDIVLLDLRGQCSFTDYFVICTGTSERQLDALADAVETAARKQFRLKSPRRHGQPVGGWLLIDFVDVIVHVFSPQQREHYQLEEFWHAGKVIVRIQ